MLKRNTYAAFQHYPSALFYLILLDIFFFPYPPGLPLPLSAILALCLLIAQCRRLDAKNTALSAILITLALLSVMASMAFPSGIFASMSTKVINFGIIGFMAILLLSITSRQELDISGAVTLAKFYIYFQVSLAVLFFLNPTSYFVIRANWTLSGNVIEINQLNILTRFTGTLSDPNNMSAIACSVLAFVLFRQRHRIYQNLFLILATALIAVCTMSITGFICFAFVFFTYLAFVRLSQNSIKNFLQKFVIIVAALSIFAAFLNFMSNTEIGALALQRIEVNSVSTRTSKLEILGDTEKVMGAIFLGDGGVVDWNGKRFSPHNGHLHIALNYGLFAYIVFMFLFFPVFHRKRPLHAVFLVPIFLGFSANVGIYEPRYGAIWATLLAVYSRELKLPNIQASDFKSVRTPLARQFS